MKAGSMHVAGLGAVLLVSLGAVRAEAGVLCPGAVAFRQLGLFAFVGAGIFVGILGVGYVCAWRKKALEGA